MSHKKSFQAIDLTLLNLRNKDDIMGGVNIVRAGDLKKPYFHIKGGKADKFT